MSKSSLVVIGVLIVLLTGLLVISMAYNGNRGSSQMAPNTITNKNLRASNITTKKPRVAVSGKMGKASIPTSVTIPIYEIPTSVTVK